MEKFCEILRGKVIEDFEGEEQDFVWNVIFIGEPVKMLHDRSYITEGVLEEM